MRLFSIAIAAAAIGFAGTAHARTVVILVEPMTLDKHARVYETPGPDRYLLCMQPPSLSGCRELPAKKRG